MLLSAIHPRTECIMQCYESSMQQSSSERELHVRSSLALVDSLLKTRPSGTSGMANSTWPRGSSLRALYDLGYTVIVGTKGLHSLEVTIQNSRQHFYTILRAKNAVLDMTRVRICTSVRDDSVGAKDTARCDSEVELLVIALGGLDQVASRLDESARKELGLEEIYHFVEVIRGTQCGPRCRVRRSRRSI